MPKDITKNEKKEKKHFFRDFKAELKRVIWPTPKQLVNNTIAVIVIVLIVSAIVLVLDLAFESINHYGIDKLRAVIGTETNEQVQNNEQVENEASNQEENNTENNQEANNTQNQQAENNTQNNENKNESAE